MRQDVPRCRLQSVTWDVDEGEVVIFVMFVCAIVLLVGEFCQTSPLNGWSGLHQ